MLSRRTALPPSKCQAEVAKYHIRPSHLARSADPPVTTSLLSIALSRTPRRTNHQDLVTLADRRRSLKDLGRLLRVPYGPAQHQRIVHRLRVISSSYRKGNLPTRELQHQPFLVRHYRNLLKTPTVRALSTALEMVTPSQRACPHGFPIFYPLLRPRLWLNRQLQLRKSTRLNSILPPQRGNLHLPLLSSSMQLGNERSMAFGIC